MNDDAYVRKELVASSQLFHNDDGSPSSPHARAVVRGEATFALGAWADDAKKFGKWEKVTLQLARPGHGEQVRPHPSISRWRRDAGHSFRGAHVSRRTMSRDSLSWWHTRLRGVQSFERPRNNHVHHRARGR